MTETLQLVLFLGAGLLACIELVRSKGYSLPGWGVLLIAIALLLPRIPR